MMLPVLRRVGGCQRIRGEFEGLMQGLGYKRLSCRIRTKRKIESRNSFSEWTRGTDLLAESLAFGKQPKIVLNAYSPSGFDVLGMIEKVSEEETSTSGIVHMDGSIIVFPHACFLWKIKDASDVTVESLSAVMLHKPNLKYLFLGCNGEIAQDELLKIKTEFKEKAGIIVERLDVANAMGTFNILNGEDRLVAAALVVDKDQK